VHNYGAWIGKLKAAKKARASAVVMVVRALLAVAPTASQERVPTRCNACLVLAKACANGAILWRAMRDGKLRPWRALVE
jgi:hypothetical protein